MASRKKSDDTKASVRPSRWDMKRLASALHEDLELASAGLDAWAETVDGEARR